MMPMLLSICLFWIGPILLTYLANALDKMKKANLKAANEAAAKGKVCVVIGANAGIGLELCKQPSQCNRSCEP